MEVLTRDVEGVGKVIFMKMPEDLKVSLTMAGQHECRACAKQTETIVKVEPGISVPCDRKCFQEKRIDAKIRELVQAMQ